MLKLELDWASDETPDMRTTDEAPNDVIVEYDDSPGPSGWPTVTIVAIDGPTLWSWLVTVYGADEDEASELASYADTV